VSDLLSYARILALSLAGGVIAQVVNLLGTMSGLSIVGFIAFIAALAVGHGLNIALSLLSAFVHAARLQYIEFFGKFYEDGGKPFEPVALDPKYVNISGE
jgi:V/A-type H+-transporting ATPase subunit I